MTTENEKRPAIRGGSLIRLNDDLEEFISVDLMAEITDLYNSGADPETIGERYNKDPDEIFLILLHQGRRNRIKRAYAKKLK